jgi:signal transduction histidine kinase
MILSRSKHGWSRPYSVRLLLTLLLLAALVPILLVRVGTYLRLLQTQYQAALDGNLELARAAASAFNAYANDVGREELAIGMTLASLEPPSSPQARDFLVTNAAQYPPIIRLHWVDLQGQVINSSDPAYVGLDISNREHFHEALQKDTWVIANLVPSIVDGAPIFMIDRCIRDKSGTPQGVVAAVIEPHRLEREILNIGRAPGGRIMILDRQRRIVCSDPPMNLSWEKRGLADNELYQKAAAGQEALGGVRSSLDGQQRAAALVPIGRLGWVAVASRPLSSIRAPLWDDLLMTGAVTLVVLVASLLLALLIRRQISRGVKGLQDHAAALAEGDLDHRAEITGIAELQAVAEAFNRTAARRQQAEGQLRELNETLEQRVAERTAVAEQRAQQLRAMAAELSQTEQRERRRLARMLHDDLQQLLAASKFHAGALQGRLTDDALRKRLAKVIDLLDESIKTSRSLTIDLSPPILYDSGLPAALSWLACWMQNKHGLRVEVRADEAANPQAEEIRVCLFQSARELLFNITKHAAVKRASIELHRSSDGQVQLIVRDDGAGFDPAQRQGASAGGLGLFGIRERLELLGGRMEIDSAPGAGTRVTLTAPPTAPERGGDGDNTLAENDAED